MDLTKIQKLQADLEKLFQLIGVNFITPSVEIDETSTVKVDLEVNGNYETEEGDRGSLGLIIGTRGDTLRAFEYLVALMINRDRDEWLHVKMDVDGYRERREEDLQSLAIRMADKARFKKGAVELKPMNSADRRIVHMALSEVEDVQTESTGEGRDRHVVITATA